ncbi:ribosome recycling factor [Desulfofarcimen acetoxidans DSM 771]|jgi:ribosome recycling factor|uniref:Ribosome-recycling factor n=1 Tax=Desulfofarcimen acetoxidans (strain ATCC 49208 / DSM 771 / KCTC 5769 / VKM B-1644 / 5575) TaxID=485916 RepID=C8W4R5_DESAS|nr:ribosome recycling factor [Desulfofarcimen acetoxidans]ACV63951.1 ribosome recycling factor [Desulfofarcimen acetoxidans DSM 771]
MYKEILEDAEDSMKKTVEVVKKDFASLRAGRATPGLLDKINVDYYGTPTPVNQLANVSVPEARLLVIQPWDKSVIPALEKAILKSDLGITPNSDGVVIRLAVPQLTEERRKDLVKVVKKKAEEGRVAVRNIRRDANDLLKSEQKDGNITEDDSRRAQDEVQKLTDKYIKDIDQLMANKEKEIMQV